VCRGNCQTVSSSDVREAVETAGGLFASVVPYTNPKVPHSGRYQNSVDPFVRFETS